jgi:hypothetical protein
MASSNLIFMATVSTVSSRETARFGIYAGTFLISFTSLALEITITRLLSVITLYHLAFFAVSVAMLGMTAGAVTVYLKPGWFTSEKLRHTIARSCSDLPSLRGKPFFSLSRLPGDWILPAGISESRTAYYSLLLPFLPLRDALTAVLTKFKLPIGKRTPATWRGPRWAAFSFWAPCKSWTRPA